MLNLVRRRVVRQRVDVEEILRSSEAQSVCERFNRLYYESGVAGELSWRGVPLLKNPCDLWVMAELIQKLRPAVIVETGTHHGGSALFLADITKLLGLHTAVVTVDFNPKWTCDPHEHGIESVVGFSTDPWVVQRVQVAVNAARERADGGVMVTLDSDHAEENVLSELRLYSPLVTRSSYIVVEDTNINGHPVSPDFGPGPYEAVEKFLGSDSKFQRDITCERHLLTFNPGGWLLRVT